MTELFNKILRELYLKNGPMTTVELVNKLKRGHFTILSSLKKSGVAFGWVKRRIELKTAERFDGKIRFSTWELNPNKLNQVLDRIKKLQETETNNDTNNTI